MQHQLPILYSLQNCPYAMRARLAIFKSQQSVIVRAIKLNNKPAEMLQASSKGTVPVLIIEQQEVIDESLDIMLWALKNNDPANLLQSQHNGAQVQMRVLIAQFETAFIPALNVYSCAKRYHEDNLIKCRMCCEVLLKQLENRLTKHSYLYSEQESLVDIALLPFLRKFSKIERSWFQSSPYPRLRQWLNQYLKSAMFTKVMAQHELWIETGKQYHFPK